jgi:hypothetical protein
MLAIVLTGVVVLVAYGAASVGLDARARLAADLSRVEGTHAARELLADALRNTRSPDQSGQPGFTVSHDTLSFVAAGGAGPLDPDYDWLISAAPGPHGLDVTGIPLGHAEVARVAFRLRGITHWHVQVLGVGESGWQTQWSEANVTPRAVTIGFWNDSVPVTPLRVVLWASESPQRRDSLPEN